MTILDVSKAGMMSAMDRTNKAAQKIVSVNSNDPNSLENNNSKSTGKLTGAEPLMSDSLAASIVELNSAKQAFKANAKAFSVAAQMSEELTDRVAGRLFDDKM